MKTCPRCKLSNKNTRQCEYCGLVFDDVGEAAGASSGPGGKRVGLAILVLLFIGAGAAYWFHAGSSQPQTSQQLAAEKPRNQQKTVDSELKQTARELSGGTGLLNDVTEGTSRGSLIAVVFFSVIGIGYLTYGKKSQQLLMVVCGIALMGYSYFVSGTLLIVLIGVGLSVLPFVVGYLGD